jgi:hypothetical protein
MKIFISQYQEEITIRSIVESDPSDTDIDIIGDINTTVLPGGSFMGMDYDFLADNIGQLEIEVEVE